MNAHLLALGIRSRVLDEQKHRELEAAWRTVYGTAFCHRVRHRHGQKAIYEYLQQREVTWLVVPFLADVPRLPINVRSPLRLTAHECVGPLTELSEFHDVEFFVSPADFAWTFIRTHEDYTFGGPYFVRAEWVEEATPQPSSR